MKNIKAIAIKSRGLAKWLGLGATLIAAGFAVDGATEVGHHLFLILGGVAVGVGAVKEAK